MYEFLFEGKKQEIGRNKIFKKESQAKQKTRKSFKKKNSDSNVVAHSYIPSLGMLRQEDQEFKASLDCIVNSRPAYAAWKVCSKNYTNNKTKKTTKSSPRSGRTDMVNLCK